MYDGFRVPPVAFVCTGEAPASVRNAGATSGDGGIESGGTTTNMPPKSRAERVPSSFAECMDDGVEKEDKGERFGHGAKAQRCATADKLL